MAPSVFFWRQEEEIGNFGDALTLLYRERLFTDRCLFGAGSLHLVGSVITPHRLKQAKRDGYRPNDWQGRAIFWGCGKKDGDPLAPELQRGAIFLGVRGTLSRDALGLPRAATPLGDTALLLPRFYTPRPDARTAGRVLWVPHFHHEDPTPEALAETPDHCVMRPAIPNTVEACERFVDAIASARFVMANAMHAAVVALAYGVPFAFWRGSAINHPFKWADFTSGVGFDLPFCDSVQEGRALFERVRPDRAFAEVNLKPLLDVAPYQPRITLSSPKAATAPA
jgi:hypothetical protein